MKVLINSVALAVFFAVLYGLFYFYCIRMPGQSYQGPLPEPDAQLQASAERLREHVRVLADKIGARNVWKPEKLRQAAQYIEDSFTALKFVPKSEIVNNKGNRNIIVDIYGSKYRDRIIVVGAHYDTVPSSPGADDNASGVSALLELARTFRDKKLPVTLRLAAFVNEERPFFGGGQMGSLFNAKRSRELGEHIIGMYSLEMIGFYSDAPRSQYYPRPVRRFYPRTGNFIAFVGNLMSRDFLHQSLSAFRRSAEFPSQGLVAPQLLVPDIRRSDNAAFWFHGYPAVMITDTSNFRNWNYHNAGDKYGTLDYQRMALVVQGLSGMLEAVARQQG
jgi:Zn-dependent M28 family amino/carboxypeptidase